MANSKHPVSRGDIYYAELSPVVGSEQGGKRPVVILQNNVGDFYSPTVIVAAITAESTKPNIPTHVLLPADQSKIAKDSVILLEQVRTIDKSRLKDQIDHLSPELMQQVEAALKRSLGLDGYGSTFKIFPSS